MNCAARAVPFLDLLQALTTGRTWFEVAPTVRYDLVGRLGSGASAKDAFLSIAAEYGSHAATNLEFGGPGLRHLSIAARRTLATMAAELGAEFAVFEADDLLLAFVRARSTAAFEEQNPDPGAGYAARRTVDLGGVVPLLALPDAVLGQVVAVSHAAGTRIDQAFIGSCANGSLEDLEAAAAVVKGRKVASGVRMIVTPGSQAIYRAALKAGYVETLAEAGAIVTPATCGACAGGHSGVLGPGEVCITASTRNYKGRMGHASARIYMASPATVAASALVGAIAHPGEFVTECPT